MSPTVHGTHAPSSHRSTHINPHQSPKNSAIDALLIYTAVNADAALEEFERFDQTWGTQHPNDRRPLVHRTCLAFVHPDAKQANSPAHGGPLNLSAVLAGLKQLLPMALKRAPTTLPMASTRCDGRDAAR